MLRISGATITLAIMAITAAGGFFLPPPSAFSQEEVASSIRRYKASGVSSGYYEEYEVRPAHQTPLLEIPGVSRKGLFPYSPSAASVRVRTRLSDSHQGIKFYENLRCELCHVGETKDIHTTRANLTCRQCHGGEPIASIEHYYAPMNPIRKHAYVCAKCHEGASASYASYMVHAPSPGMNSTLKTFPALFYIFWIMVLLAIGTFVVFLPHTIFWGIREFFIKKEKNGNGAGKQN